MSEVKVINDDKIQLNLSYAEAGLLVQLLGRFHPNAAGQLGSVYEELKDAGVEPFENTVLLTQNEPTLHWVLVSDSPLDNGTDVV